MNKFSVEYKEGSVWKLANDFSTRGRATTFGQRNLNGQDWRIIDRTDGEILQVFEAAVTSFFTHAAEDLERLQTSSAMARRLSQERANRREEQARRRQDALDRFTFEPIRANQADRFFSNPELDDEEEEEIDWLHEGF